MASCAYFSGTVAPVDTAIATTDGDRDVRAVMHPLEASVALLLEESDSAGGRPALPRFLSVS